LICSSSWRKQGTSNIVVDRWDTLQLTKAQEASELHKLMTDALSLARGRCKLMADFINQVTTTQRWVLHEMDVSEEAATRAKYAAGRSKYAPTPQWSFHSISVPTHPWQIFSTGHYYTAVGPSQAMWLRDQSNWSGGGGEDATWHNDITVRHIYLE
jgi:hypothetical protein